MESKPSDVLIGASLFSKLLKSDKKYIDFVHFYHLWEEFKQKVSYVKL